MKNVILIVFLLGFMPACKQAPKKLVADVPTDTGKLQDDPDLIAVTDVIHNFYKWYNAFQKNDQTRGNFVNFKGKHLKLDNPKVDAYFTHFANSGFMSQAYIDYEKAYLKKCEALWQKEKDKDGSITGLDADRCFCAQDWDINFWTTSPVSAEGLGTNNIKATLFGTEGGSPREQKFDLVKENGKWLIARIDCTMLPDETSLVSETPASPYALTVNQNGDMTLGGKKITLENLKKNLLGILMKQSVMPKSVPIRYDGEVLMGMRGEVETEVSQALTAAIKARSKKTSPIAKAKTPSIAPTSIGALPTLAVSKKGEITLNDKKVPLDELKKELQNKLVKLETLPNKIPVLYEGKPSLGMRAKIDTIVNEAIAGAKWLKKSKSLTPTPVAYNTKSPMPISLAMTEKGEITFSGKKIDFDNIKKEVQTYLLKLSVIPDEIPVKFQGTTGMGTRAEVRTEVEAAIAGAKWIRKKAALDALLVPVEKKLTIPIQFEVNDYITSGNFAFAFLTLKHKDGSKMDYKGTPYERQFRLGGSISDNVFGLFKYENGVWKILTYSLGPTDVPYINWEKEYNAPKELFD